MTDRKEEMTEECFQQEAGHITVYAQTTSPFGLLESGTRQEAMGNRPESFHLLKLRFTGSHRKARSCMGRCASAQRKRNQNWVRNKKFEEILQMKTHLCKVLGSYLKVFQIKSNSYSCPSSFTSRTCKICKTDPTGQA